jgi:hypothetical protein
MTDSSPTNRAALERLMTMISARELDALEDVLDPEFVQEIPQSGERIRGIPNFRRSLEAIGGPGRKLEIAIDPYIVGTGEHFMMTPTFNVVKVTDQGDELTSYVKAQYPDGTDWYIISFTTFRDHKVLKRVDFFAPFFDPPESRADVVEIMDR